jgi:hypothetical protein
MKSEAAAPVVFVVDDVRSLDYPLRVRGREHLHGDSDRWNQICAAVAKWAVGHQNLFGRRKS